MQLRFDWRATHASSPPAPRVTTTPAGSDFIGQHERKLHDLFAEAFSRLHRFQQHEAQLDTLSVEGVRDAIRRQFPSVERASYAHISDARDLLGC